MWIALAGAALVALLLGWSLRGMLLMGRLRRAEVDRDVTKVELGEARDEIERLFAAQRKLLAGQGGAPAFEAAQVSPQADPALEQQLAETLTALRQAREELDALKAAPPVLAPAPEMTAVPSVDGAAMLRTKELEDRVAALEADLAEARRALTDAEVARAEAVAAAAAVPAPAPVEVEAEAPPTAEADPKLVWKASYLALRVKALENEVAAQPAAVATPAPVAEEGTPAAAPSAPEAPKADEESPEEELARLRWRNRYLEGRLAYFEGDQDSVADEIAAEDDAVADLELEPEAEAGIEDKPEEADDAFDELEDYAGEDEGDEDGFEEEDADEGAFAAETILGRLEEDDALADAGEADDVVPARPLALERPVEGAPDDLTLIGGIGPRIQEVLNSLGIFHFDQIADWSPENIAWVDEYLHFNGRVKREGWVEQAAILVGEGAEP
jgi:predicted flap endonuclease-1-like 5' DNA nuclease